MKTLFILLITVVGSIRGYAQSADEIAIIALLDRQAVAWNEGNLEKFMGTYWKSDSLMFVGKDGITYGYEATLERYRKSYPDRAAMGKLALKILHSRRLSADTYFVVGRYEIERAAGNLEGHYTLLVKKVGGRWVIVTDHSS